MNDLLQLTHKILEGHGIKAKKGYGQNFLVDSLILDQIYRSLPISEVDEIVEIGPGLGFLTEKLLLSNKPLTVIEADPDMVAILKERFGDKFKIISGDVKKVDFNMFHVKQTLFVGNLPYNITKSIIEKIGSLEKSTYFSFMVQKEVGIKLHYKQGDYIDNALSAYLALRGEFKREIPVNRTSFSPVPNVDSVFMNYNMISEEYTIKDYAFLQKLYSAPNKMIANNLNEVLKNLPEEYLKLRPHQLSLSDLDKLIKLYRSSI